MAIKSNRLKLTVGEPKLFELLYYLAATNKQVAFYGVSCHVWILDGLSMRDLSYISRDR